MKYLKYVFSSILLAGSLGFAGCGSDGDSRSDGDRNVAVEIIIAREIKVEGVVRGYKTGAPLSNIEVRLYQAGVRKTATTVDKDGHYAFSKVKVSDDKSVENANNSANDIQLEFVELKVENSEGNSGSTHYSNGSATTPTYPDSRIEMEYVSPEFINPPQLTAADQAAQTLVGSPASVADTGLGAPGTLTLTDAINEGRSYYFTDSNTVRVRDVRLVQSGSLTGSVADAKTGLPPSAIAYLTLDTDPMFLTAGQLEVSGDIVAVWQQTRITTTSSLATGEFTFESVPALDYRFTATEIFHVEAQGYREASQTALGTNLAAAPAAGLANDHSNIQDDIDGSVGVILLTPMTYETIAVTMTVVDQNLAPLSGVAVTFIYDNTIAANPGSGYGLRLANGLETATQWPFTTDANGKISGSVPNISFVNAVAADKNLTVIKSGYALQGYNAADTDLAPALTHDNNPVDLDVTFANLSIYKADLGVVHMQAISVPMGEKFTIQLVYNGQPIKGVTSTGVVAAVHPVTGIVANYTVTGDAASDANGFLSFSNSIPAGLYDTAAQGILLSFDTTAATNGITGTDLSSLSLKLNAASDAADSSISPAAVDGKMDFNNVGAPRRLEPNGGAGGILLIGESGATVSVVFEGSDKLVGTLQGYLVEGTQAKTAGIVASQTVGLSVTPLSRLAKTYFSTTDSTGKYIFTSTAAPTAPVTGTAYSVKIPVGVDGAVNNAISRLLKLKLMDTSKVFSVWVTNAFATTVTDAGLSTDGTEIWLNSSTNIAARNGVDQISTGTNTWLEQLNGDNAGTSALLAGYADQTLTVHTAQIQDITKLQNGFHVVTLVDESDSKPVIYTSNVNSGNSNYGQRTVYTFATSGDSDAIKIIMSGAVDYTKTWIHTGGAQATTENKVTINAVGAPGDTYVAANTDGNDATTLGTEFVYDTTAVGSDVTAAVGRSIVITPGGNAAKFELGVIYRMLVSVYDANGNKSDDTIEFRFFDKPSYAQTTPTLAVRQMIIQNDTAANNRNIGWANSNIVAADLASYSIAWNDKDLDDVVDAREVNVLLSNVGTGVATAAMGSKQSASIKLNRVTLRFLAPTKADDSAFTTAELTALDALNEFRVYAQAYKKTDGRIIRSWTNVSHDTVAGGNINGDDQLGSSFSAETAGYWTISCDLDGVVDTGILTFAQALAAGHSVDLVVVHKTNQIDATKALTLNGTRSGVQPSAILNAATEFHVDNINFATSANVIVSLNEAVSATNTSTPTMTVVDTRLTLVSPRYLNDQQMQGQLTWTAPTTRTSVTTQALSAIANTVVPSNGGVIVGNDIYVANGSLTSANNTLFARNTSINNKLANVAAFANNVTVNQFQSYTNTALPVINDQTVVAFTNAAGAQTSVGENPIDNSTTTSIDIDWTGIVDTGGATATYTVSTAAITAANIWNAATTTIKYANCNDDLKAMLNTLPIGYRLYLSNGTSLTLLANSVLNSTWTVGAVNANATAGTGDTTDARNTFNINAPVGTTTLFNLVVYGRVECAAGLVAADNTNAGTFQDSVTQNNAFGLRSAIAFTAVPRSTTAFTYTEVGGQRLRIGDTLHISQKQSAIGDVWNHGTALVTGVLTNGTANFVTIGALTGIDGTTATTFVFTQGTAVTDIHVIFYGDQVTVGLGGATGLITSRAGNTASTLVVGSISLPSQTADVTDVFKDASTNSATSDYVMGADGLPTGTALTFGANIYDIFVR